MHPLKFQLSVKCYYLIIRKLKHFKGLIMINEIFVKIGEIATAKAPTILKTVLGSCVAIVLYDEINKIGGMIHIVLPKKRDEREYKEGWFADTGIPILIAKTKAKGANLNNIQGFVFGGNNAIRCERSANEPLKIGENNILFVRNLLKEKNIKFEEHGTLQSYGTKVSFDLSSGKSSFKLLKNETTKCSDCYNEENQR